MSFRVNDGFGMVLNDTMEHDHDSSYKRLATLEVNKISDRLLESCTTETETGSLHFLMRAKVALGETDLVKAETSHWNRLPRMVQRLSKRLGMELGVECSGISEDA
jgi:hypothetical protein